MLNQFVHQHSIIELFKNQTRIKELRNVITNQFPRPKENNLTHISREDIQTFLALLECSAEFGEWSEDIESCIHAVFQALRNSTAFNANCQNLIIEESSILSCINSLWSRIEASEFLLNICLQFLTNLVVQNERSAFSVWKYFQTSILDQLKERNCAEMTVSLYYNILLMQPPNLQINLDILHCLLALHETKDTEIITYCLQNLLVKQHLLLFYNSLQENYKLVILQTLLDCINIGVKLTRLHIKFVTDTFKMSCQFFVAFYTKRENKFNEQGLETIDLVQILAALTSDDESLRILQEDRDLFMETFRLLKNIHEVGNLYPNVFTPINKLSYDNDSTQEQEELLGFKSALIRIIGNLCNNHAVNQNEIRHIDGIGLILDCCNIDSRNPLILQWSIYAIRNICKENQENQNHISSMTVQRDTHFKIRLNEMG